MMARNGQNMEYVWASSAMVRPARWLYWGSKVSRMLFLLSEKRGLRQARESMRLGAAKEICLNGLKFANAHPINISTGFRQGSLSGPHCVALSPVKTPAFFGFKEKHHVIHHQHQCEFAERPTQRFSFSGFSGYIHATLVFRLAHQQRDG
jgi:hypothetical protein